MSDPYAERLHFQAARHRYAVMRVALLRAAANDQTPPEHLLAVVRLYREAYGDLVMAAEAVGYDTATVPGGFIADPYARPAA